MQKGTMLGIASLILLSGYIGYNEFPQQIAIATGEDKVFTHAIDLVEAIEQAEYTDNTPVQASSSPPVVIITNWDDVKALDKANIITQAHLYGYEELTP